MFGTAPSNTQRDRGSGDALDYRIGANQAALVFVTAKYILSSQRLRNQHEVRFSPLAEVPDGFALMRAMAKATCAPDGERGSGEGCAFGGICTDRLLGTEKSEKLEIVFRVQVEMRRA